jgi:hypothetical protein
MWNSNMSPTIEALSLLTSSSDDLYCSSSSCIASATMGNGLPLCAIQNLSRESRSQGRVFTLAPPAGERPAFSSTTTRLRVKSKTSCANACKKQWYSETSIHRFRRGSEKETIDAGAIVEIGFAQGPKKLNDRSRKTNYPGTIDRGFTVLYNRLRTIPEVNLTKGIPWKGFILRYLACVFTEQYI